MKKHIRKKYQFQHKFQVPENSSLINVSLENFDQPTLKANYKKSNLFISTETDIYLGFIYNNSGNYVPIALPDFTLVYFDYAYKQNIRRREIKTELLNKLSDSEKLTEDRSHELYEFYGVSTSCIISLFTSIESFINHLLPDNGIYKAERQNRTEIYNREQIQQGIQFMDKLKKVLPQFFGKNFFSKPSKAASNIENLKELRDKLVHTKSDMTFETHIDTFQKLLNFKYDEVFDAVGLLFNFYKNNYIEPCPCDSDF
ncbi:MAG: hypothetical protein ABI203_00970 [Mucilaginibacter sp.]